MYKILHFVLKLLSRVPFRLLYFLSDVLFFPLFYIVRYRRSVVRQNLVSSFPEKSLEEIRSIERRFYRFFVDMVVESCKLLSLSEEEMMRRARFVNAEIVNEKLRQGKNVSVFIGHYANWEWISTYSLWIEQGGRVVQIFHKLSNDVMNRLMLELRERFGSTSVDKYNTVRYIAGAVKGERKMVVGFIADQSPKKREAKHFLQFMNHNVPVLTGTEKLTKHYDFEAFFLSVRRVSRGYYEYEFEPLHESPASLPDYELTSLYYRRLEQEIRQRPEYYLWTHKRFKYATKLNEESFNH